MNKMRYIVDIEEKYDIVKRRNEINICKGVKENKKGSPYSRYYS
jgi:hypothetical protein